MDSKMVAAIWTGTGIELRDAPVPTLSADLGVPLKRDQSRVVWFSRERLVLVKNLKAGICGTDLAILRGEHAAKSGVIPGHEYIGRVTAVGEAVESVQCGDLVAVDPNSRCGRCWACVNGRSNHCAFMTTFGIFGNGGFAQYSVVPEGQVHLLPVGMSANRAVLFEPLTCVTHGLAQINCRLEGKSILIFGAGPIGRFFLEIARLQGAHLIVVAEPSGFRRAHALLAGSHVALDPLRRWSARDIKALAKKNGNFCGFDVVIEASGKAEVLPIAIDSLIPGGILSIFGQQNINSEVTVNPTSINQKEIIVVGSYITRDTYGETVSLLNNNDAKWENLITHEFALCDVCEAYSLVESRKCVKVIINTQEI